MTEHTPYPRALYPQPPPEFLEKIRAAIFAVRMVSDAYQSHRVNISLAEHHNQGPFAGIAAQEIGARLIPSPDPEKQAMTDEELMADAHVVGRNSGSSETRDMIERLCAVIVARQWKPIETAPREVRVLIDLADDDGTWTGW